MSVEIGRALDHLLLVRAELRLMWQEHRRTPKGEEVFALLRHLDQPVALLRETLAAQAAVQDPGGQWGLEGVEC